MNQQIIFKPGGAKLTFVIQFRLVIFELQLLRFYFSGLLLMFLRLCWPPNGPSGS